MPNVTTDGLIESICELKVGVEIQTRENTLFNTAAVLFSSEFVIFTSNILKIYKGATPGVIPNGYKPPIQTSEKGWVRIYYPEPDLDILNIPI